MRLSLQAPPKVLLVEGKDDLYVVANLCDAYGVPDRAFHIKDKEGYNKLVHDLSTELQASELEYLGILVDADIDVRARWDAVRNVLVSAGYTLAPAQPDAAGVILRQPDQPTVGVWIMPDNRLPGMLEDFVAALVPRGDDLWPRVQNCLGQLPEASRRFPANHLIKAQLHTWLAWQREPGDPFGVAITKRYLDPQAAEARPFLEWLRSLFQI